MVRCQIYVDANHEMYKFGIRPHDGHDIITLDEKLDQSLGLEGLDP